MLQEVDAMCNVCEKCALLLKLCWAGSIQWRGKSLSLCSRSGQSTRVETRGKGVGRMHRCVHIRSSCYEALPHLHRWCPILQFNGFDSTYRCGVGQNGPAGAELHASAKKQSGNSHIPGANPHFTHTEEYRIVTLFGVNSDLV